MEQARRHYTSRGGTALRTMGEIDRRYDVCMTSDSKDDGTSKGWGRRRRVIVAIALWLVAAFVVGAVLDVLLSKTGAIEVHMPPVGTLHAWFWEDDGSVRISFHRPLPEDDPPSGWIIFSPEDTYYEPSGLVFPTRSVTSRLTLAFYDDGSPDEFVPPERVDRWRPAIADAMMGAGYSSELVDAVREPDYHRRGWNLWAVFLNGLVLVGPSWVLYQFWRVAGLGPLPLTRHQRRLVRLRHGRCPNCGYDIRGLPQRQCPECGETWSADEAPPMPTAP